MFKAIKDDKIIAINETGKFPCLVYDSVEDRAGRGASPGGPQQIPGADGQVSICH